MSEADVSMALKPIVSFLKVADGEPHLEGQKCARCGVVYVGERPAVAGVTTCGACGARGAMEAVRLANTGKLYNWTIVRRSFPGAKVPFISVIVDLDGGGSLRGNLIDVDPSPAAIRFDMPVKVVYGDAGRQDKDGASYLSYFFAPA
jgi:uncharacterized protein